MPFWADFYKYTAHAYKLDALAKKRKKREIDSIGITQPDAVPEIRADNQWSGGGGRSQIRLRDSNDFIDLTSVTNRLNRYKEYERLRFVAEIEAALDILADESCVAGNTPICTPFGNFEIQELARVKKPDEKFLVYCYDFHTNDYTLGWAHNPRKVKTAPTIKLHLNDGTTLTVTEDHRILNIKREWVQAGSLTEGSELVPFHRIRANGTFGIKSNQYPRIFTFADGWKHERQFIDEWRIGNKADYPAKLRTALKFLTEGVGITKTIHLMNEPWTSFYNLLAKYGFVPREILSLTARYPAKSRIVSIDKGEVIDVYDLSVDVHENFASPGCILHNCQKGQNKHTFDIVCKNAEVKKELEYLYHRLIKVDKVIWNWAKNLYCMGDWFGETLLDPDDPTKGIVAVNALPAESMFRIETTKGKLLEFQQSASGPDYQSLARVDVAQATDVELNQATAIRFHPKDIIHMRIGDDRKTFYPYGVSIIEPARGPAHQLRLMEDAMVVYRLCLIGDTRIRTTKGYKLLRNIIENQDYAYSYSSDNISPSLITKLVNNGLQDVFKVRSKHVEIVGNKTHPLLVLRDNLYQYVEIQNLIPKSDKLILTSDDKSEQVKIPLFEGEIWAKLSTEQRDLFRNKTYNNKSALLRQCHNYGRAKQFVYAEGKALPLTCAEKICDIFGLDKTKLILTNKNQRNIERLNLPVYVDEEFAKLFGFLCGDGFIHNNNQFGFAAGDDKAVNKHYKKILKKYFSKVRFEQDKRKNKGIGKYVVDSTFGCELLTRMGYINNHDINRIPEWVFTSPKNIRRSFVEGLSDADGCERYTKKGTWFSTIELSNKELVKDVKELWSSIGLCSGHLKERTRENGHEIEPGHIMPPTTSYLVTISECLLPQHENVLTVEFDGQQEVYDMTVSDPRANFIANSIPVHNTRAPERRVFYIDVGGLPPNKAEAFIERLKDGLRKKKMYTNRSTQTGGAGSVEERWHAPAADEDFWLPIRPNGNTRIDTLPGAQNLGEVDDALYFRNKLLTALHLPNNYMSQEDPNISSKPLASQNFKFARYVERLQMSLANGLQDIGERHLTLRGFPEEMWEDFEIEMTPPSDWREASRMDIMQARYGNAVQVTSGPSPLMSRYDALIDILKYQPNTAKDMSDRAKMQAIEDAKIQLMTQNPELAGVGQSGNEQEMGSEAGGPNPMLGGDQQQSPPDQQTENEPTEAGPAGRKEKSEGKPLPEPEPEDIKKYDLEIRDYSKEKDIEEIDPVDVE